MLRIVDILDVDDKDKRFLKDVSVIGVETEISKLW